MAAVPAPEKKKSLLRRIVVRTVRVVLLIVLILGAIATGLAIWILFFFPNDLAIRTATRLAGQYGFELGIGALDVRPLHDVTVENLRLDVPSNKRAGIPALISVGKAHVAWDLRAALDRKVHLTSIEVTDPHVHLESRDGKWNWARALDDIYAGPLFVTSNGAAATPTPAATPALPIEEQLQAQSQQIDQLLGSLPVEVHVDSIAVRGAGVDVVNELGTIATVDGAAADITLHLPRGGAAKATLSVPAEPGIAIAVQPSGETGFSGTVRPAVRVEMDLPKKVSARADIHLADGLLVAKGLELPVLVKSSADLAIDVPAGDVSVKVTSFDVDRFLDAQGELALRAFGTKGIHASWHSAVDGDHLPDDVGPKLASALTATRLHPGATISGSLDGKIASTDVAALQKQLAHGTFPLTLTLKSDGESADDPIEARGVKIGKLIHHAEVTVTATAADVQSEATITRIAVPQAFGGRPFSLHIVNHVSVPATLDAVDLGTAAAQLPEHGIAVEGHGRLAGLKGALAAWSAGQGAQTNASTMRAGLAALTALSEIRLAGSFDFASKKSVEVAPGTTIRGGIHAKAEITRGQDPFGRLKAEVRYDEFTARIDDTSKLAAKTKTGLETRFAAQPELVHSAAVAIAARARAAAMAAASNGDLAETGGADGGDKPLLLIDGMTADLTVDRDLILGGHPKLEALQLAADEAEMFDPATRGYYDRLGSLRADADNFRIRKVVAGPLRISDLTAEVLYDGNAVHINRGHMQLLGGEVVGRMIIRPTAEGVHFAMSGDMSGIDMSPLLLDHPLADPNDTRVHISSAASFFLAHDDPIGSLADARVRMDMTCAGSKVIDTVLAWLDPENKDPMYNWARAVNKKVVGLTRPQISSVADRGMYDITIAFPSLGLSKDVRRIPLAPMLRLKFTQEMVGGFAPPGELLPLLAARGIDADGNFLIPPIKKPED